MFKIELENRDFRKSMCFYKVDARKKNEKRAAGACQCPGMYIVYIPDKLMLYHNPFLFLSYP